MNNCVVRDSLGSLVGVLWAGGEIWHNAVLYHDSNYMGVDPKGEYVLYSFLAPLRLQIEA